MGWPAAGGSPPRLVIMDVRYPSAPQVIGSLSLTELSDASRMAIVGNYAYVAGITETLGSRQGSLQVVDVSDPRNPRWVGSSLLPPFSEATDVAASGRYIYVTDRWLGLRTFDGNNPRNPQEIAYLAFPGSVMRVATDGSYLYGIGPGNKLWILNAPNPSPPWLAGYQDLSTHELHKDALDITASMNRVYIAMSGQLEIIDARNPAAPTGVPAHYPCLGRGCDRKSALCGQLYRPGDLRCEQSRKPPTDRILLKGQRSR